MKYDVEIDDCKMSLDLQATGDHVTATIEGRSYNARIARPQDGVYLMFVGDQVYEARVFAEETNRLTVKLRGRSFRGRVIDARHRRQAIEHSMEGPQLLSAPMPGKVVRVLLSPGDRVIAGQGVVIVEAMKMQSEIKALKTGEVRELRVKEGETVNAGQVLAVVV